MIHAGRATVLDGVVVALTVIAVPACSGGCRAGARAWSAGHLFTPSARDAQLDLNAGATKSDLLRAMEGHAVAEGQLMGTYQRT